MLFGTKQLNMHGGAQHQDGPHIHHVYIHVYHTSIYLAYNYI